VGEVANYSADHIKTGQLPRLHILGLLFMHLLLQISIMFCLHATYIIIYKKKPLTKDNVLSRPYLSATTSLPVYLWAAFYQLCVQDTSILFRIHLFASASNIQQAAAT